MKAQTKIPFAFATLVSLVMVATSCDDFLGVKGTGDKLTENRNVENFHALEISAHGQVDLRVDSVYRVEVTCEESIIDFLETVEDNGVLKIHFDRDVYDVDGLRIRVWAPNWDAIETSGSVDVNAPDAISGDDLEIKLSGSGNMRLFDVDFQEINTQISGDGNIILGGSAHTLNCSISGSGNVDALDCPVQIAKVTISGSGNAKLDVSEQLDVIISGSGNVEYKGNPVVTSQISGSGKVKKI
ncbi:MAG: DUF2807 domain-containing protein [Haliscomenobacteraceae bacterium CHB4]|nr:hypothetical protein [Saprospiraceae bacterium]MCE7926055.1 DUF2807 domain-containing protein [Haliscomenobacteraceae bacterium CHB4]